MVSASRSGFFFASAALVVVILILPRLAVAQFEGTYEVAIKKQEEKKAARWSLADWLVQKQKNQLSDLWLAKNSHSSLYEFFIDTESYNTTLTNSSSPGTLTNHNMYGGKAGLYAGVVGLRGGYEADTENRSAWFGSFNVRIFGRALQDTHINLEYGLRGMTLAPGASTGGSSPESFQNQFGGATLDIYLTKHFGLEGVYHRYLPVQSNLQRTLEGEDEQAGIFIDFGILRVFGNWKNQYLKYDGGSLPNSTEVRQGFGGGLRLYF